jgi:hypothetical protein
MVGDETEGVLWEGKLPVRGEFVPKSPGTGTPTCVHCGYLEDRDLNVAKNILRLGCNLRSVTLPVAACSEKPLLKQGSYHQTCQRVGVTLRATE